VFTDLCDRHPTQWCTPNCRAASTRSICSIPSASTRWSMASRPSPPGYYRAYADEELRKIRNGQQASAGWPLILVRRRLRWPTVTH
jgi:hypothetical protein